MLFRSGPVARPNEWAKHVNTPQSDAELAALRRCAQQGAPFGNDDWVKPTGTSLASVSLCTGLGDQRSNQRNRVLGRRKHRCFEPATAFSTALSRKRMNYVPVRPGVDKSGFNDGLHARIAQQQFSKLFDTAKVLGWNIT